MESAAVLYAGLPAGALDLSLEAARDCFTWSEEGFGDVVEQQVLRRLFAADQELLQVAHDTAALSHWNLPARPARRSRQQGNTREQHLLQYLQQQHDGLFLNTQLQQQRHDGLCLDTQLQQQQHDGLCLNTQLGQQQHDGLCLEKQQQHTSWPTRQASLQPASAVEAAGLVTCPPLAAITDTAAATKQGTTQSSSCGGIAARSGVSSAPVASAAGRFSFHAPSHAASAQAPTNQSAGPSPPLQQQQPPQPQPQPQQQQQPLPRQQQQQPAYSAGCAGLDADTSQQKAEAQARFAEQQRMRRQAEGVDSSQSSFDPATVQQELVTLAQPNAQTRVLLCMLLSNLLCCSVVLLSKGPLGRLAMLGPVHWPVLLLLLSSALTWLFNYKLKPLHFADAALEQHFSVRSQYGRCLLDVWFSLAGCSGVLAALCSSAGTAHVPGVGSMQSVAGVAAAAQAVVPLLLVAVPLAAVLLLSVSPTRYMRLREQLLFCGKVVMVAGLIATQPSIGSFPGLQLTQHTWLSCFKFGQQQQQPAASVILGMSAVQALLLLSLMVRTSAYIPMQLIHVMPLLVALDNSGTSGLGTLFQAVQMLACALWGPTAILVQLEVTARRAYLVRQLPQSHTGGAGCKGVTMRAA